MCCVLLAIAAVAEWRPVIQLCYVFQQVYDMESAEETSPRVCNSNVKLECETEHAAI